MLYTMFSHVLMTSRLYVAIATWLISMGHLRWYATVAFYPF